MARITLRSSIDLGALTILGGAISGGSAHQFTVTNGAYRFVWQGSGIEYALGMPIDGTLTGVKLYKGGTILGSVTGVSVDVDKLVAGLAGGAATSASVIWGGTDIASGSSFADTLHLHGANDVARGNAGNDRLYGGAGSDRLFGGAGNDQLHGQDGRDWLAGGLGRDVLAGGPGADRFDFDSIADSERGSARDVIIDFHQAERDRIDLSGIDADRSQPGNQAFRYVGEAAFSGKAGELRCDNGILAGDVNGDGIADFEVRVLGVDTLALSDFVL